MRTTNGLAEERLGTTWAALCLTLVLLFGAVFFGSLSLYMWALTQANNGMEMLLYSLTGVLAISCIIPGVLVWRKLRERNRYAALYGSIVAAIVILIVPMLLGVPFASYPK